MKDWMVGSGGHAQEGMIRGRREKVLRIDNFLKTVVLQQGNETAH
jgi:hypothetical protein